MEQNNQQDNGNKERHLKLLPPLPKKEQTIRKGKWGIWHWASVAVLISLLVVGNIWRERIPDVPDGTNAPGDTLSLQPLGPDQFEITLNTLIDASEREDWVSLTAATDSLEEDWLAIQSLANGSSPSNLTFNSSDISAIEGEITRLQVAITTKNIEEAKAAIVGLQTLIIQPE